MKQTIQEILSYLKYSEPKMRKKSDTIMANIFRPANQVDPMLDSGGTPKFLGAELKSIVDISEEVIARRTSIQASNLSTIVEINGKKRTVAEWIIWKREAYPILNATWSNALQIIRKVNSTSRKVDEPTPIFNIQEQNILSDLESLQNTFNQLDGLLSLNNAITYVEI